MAKTLKKVRILGISPCYQDISRKHILDMFSDKKNRIDVVFAKKEDSALLLWVREQISVANKSLVLENNGNITHLSNAQVFYDSKIKFIVDYIKDNLGKKNLLIIANGDPNFFGIGGTLLDGLKENEKRFIEIYPAISYMQIGFSKLKIPMTHASIVSLHGRSFEGLYPALNSENRITGIYTDEVNTPYKIYSELEEKGLIEKFEFYVLTELCSKNEKIYKSFTKDILEDISGKKNIVILREKNQKNKIEIIKTEDFARDKNNFNDNNSDGNIKGAGINVKINKNIIFGIDDDHYIHLSGEPTKKEIRSVSLCMMEIKEDSVIIDAGCGSGSISIEAAGLAFRGKVYSIDKNNHKIENLKKNIKKFERNNIEAITGELPDAIKNILKSKDVIADSIFIGGGGAENIDGILKESLKIVKANGIIVVNAVTIETLYAVISFIKSEGLKYEMVSVNVSRLKSIGETSYFHALNQIYVVKITKKFLTHKIEHKPEHEHKPEAEPLPAGKKRTMIFKIENKGDKNNGELNSAMPSVKVRNKAIASNKINKHGNIRNGQTVENYNSLKEGSVSGDYSGNNGNDNDNR